MMQTVPNSPVPVRIWGSLTFGDDPVLPARRSLPAARATLLLEAWAVAYIQGFGWEGLQGACLAFPSTTEATATQDKQRWKAQRLPVVDSALTSASPIVAHASPMLVVGVGLVP